MIKLNTRILFLAALALIAACDKGDKIGTTVKGERVPAMEETRGVLHADKDLPISKPSLPRMIVNMSWPQAGYDSQHAQPYVELSPHPHVIWAQPIGQGSDGDLRLLSLPVVDHGMIYTFDAAGVIRASNARTGDSRWELDTTPPERDEKATIGGLAVDGATLYATTGYGTVLAISAANGKVKWSKSLMKPLRAPPSVADNRVFVVSIDNQIDALDAGNGDILWHQEGIAESAALLGASSPAVSGDSVVVAYNSGEIFDLRPQNGRVSWTYSLTAPSQTGALPAIADIRGLPVIDHGRVYVISHAGQMAAIEARSGDRAWETDIGGINTPVAAGDAVFVYGGDNQLMALARESGRIMWIRQLAKYVDPSDKDSDKVIWTGPVLTGERLWMVNSQGMLVGFSPADGGLVDSIDLGHPLYLSPIIADHTMYVLADDGTLLALR